ncbi:lasso peptide biosynthesis B2 protein [Actinosynnema sp. NPDC059797]
MSTPILPETGASPGRVPALRARLAVLVAFVACAGSPRRLQRFLRLLARGARRPDPEDLLRWRQAVVSVSSRCAGEGCLPRSVATIVLARTFGCSATWKTGLRQDPFLAHAWVELDGVPIGEPESVRHFRTSLVVEPSFTGGRG